LKAVGWRWGILWVADPASSRYPCFVNQFKISGES
jgi:hypothetical protein